MHRFTLVNTPPAKTSLAIVISVFFYAMCLSVVPAQAAVIDSETACVDKTVPKRFVVRKDPKNVPVGQNQTIVSPTVINVIKPLKTLDEITCVVVIRNRHAKTMSFKLIPMQLSAGDKDGAEYQELDADDSAESGAAYWLTPRKQTIRLKPREVAEVPVDIRVPKNAPTGESYGAIHIATNSQNPNLDGSANVGVESRIAVPILLSVGGAGASKLVFSNPQSARVAIKAWDWHTTVRNTGNRHAAPRGYLEIKSLTGRKLLKNAIDTRTLLPGGEAETHVVWEQVPLLGVYKFTARIHDINQATSVKTSQTGWIIILPEIKFVLAMVLLLGAIGFASVMRSRGDFDDDHSES